MTDIDPDAHTQIDFEPIPTRQGVLRPSPGPVSRRRRRTTRRVRPRWLWEAYRSKAA